MRHNTARNKDIFVAVLQGETFKAAGARYGLSGSRARDVFAEVIRLLARPIMLGSDTIPVHNVYDLIAVRSHADFWLKQAEKWNPLNYPGGPHHAPQPRTETVTFWTCGIDTHHHKSKTLALRCIAYRRSDHPLTPKEQQHACDLFHGGLYPAEIARMMQRTEENVRAAVQEYLARREREEGK